MDAIEPPSLEPVGGIVMLVVVFLLRELVSGALKEIGKDMWGWAKGHRASKPVEPVGAGSDKPSLRVVRLRRRRTSHPEDEAA
jgi:hypothetical protein